MAPPSAAAAAAAAVACSLLLTRAPTPSHAFVGVDLGAAGGKPRAGARLSGGGGGAGSECHGGRALGQRRRRPRLEVSPVSSLGGARGSGDSSRRAWLAPPLGLAASSGSAEASSAPTNSSPLADGMAQPLPEWSEQEIGRIEIPGVPPAPLNTYLYEWGESRVGDSTPSLLGGGDDPDDMLDPVLAMQRGKRAAAAGESRGVSSRPRSGVPRLTLPVVTEVNEVGLTLRFEACPSDTIELTIYALYGGSSCVVVKAGGKGEARSNLMGVQVGALVRDAEKTVLNKLKMDLNSFAGEYSYVQRQKARAMPRPVSTTDMTDEETLEFFYGDVGELVGVKDKNKKPSLREVEQEEKRTREEGGGKGGEEGGEGRGPQKPQLSKTAFPGGMKVPLTELAFKDPDAKMETLNLFEGVQQGDKKGGEEDPTNYGMQGFEGVLRDLQKTEANTATDSGPTSGSVSGSQPTLEQLFEEGKKAAMEGMGGVEDQLIIPIEEDLVQLNVSLEGTGLKGGIDIFTGPPKTAGSDLVRGQERKALEKMMAVDGQQQGVGEGKGEEKPQMFGLYDEDDELVLLVTQEEMEAIDQDQFGEELTLVDFLIDELERFPKERWTPIMVEYNSVLLNPYFILSMRSRIPKMKTELRREVMGALNQRAIVLVQQLADMQQRLEMQQLEKIRTICETAMRDMSELPDKVRSMKPILGPEFLAYISYAIDKERAEIRKSGFDPNKEPSVWQQVLGVIQQGVLAEMEKEIHDDLMDIWYVLRMKHPEERRRLLEFTINDLPTLDVRRFKKVATNIVDNFAMRREADPVLRERVKEFGVLMDELLCPRRVEIMSRDADAAAKRKMDEVKDLQRLQEEYDRVGRAGKGQYAPQYQEYVSPVDQLAMETQQLRDDEKASGMPRLVPEGYDMATAIKALRARELESKINAAAMPKGMGQLPKSEMQSDMETVEEGESYDEQIMFGGPDGQSGDLSDYEGGEDAYLSALRGTGGESGSGAAAGAQMQQQMQGVGEEKKQGGGDDDDDDDDDEEEEEEEEEAWDDDGWGSYDANDIGPQELDSLRDASDSQ